MFSRRRARHAADAPTMAMPAVPDGPRVTALEYFGARLMPNYAGWWVYALASRFDGHVFYAGQSDHLISRLRDHSYQHKDLFDPARVYLIPVSDEARACVVELEIISFYQPERNTVGQVEELRAKVRLLSKPGIGGWNAGKTLDRKQANS